MKRSPKAIGSALFRQKQFGNDQCHQASIGSLLLPYYRVAGLRQIYQPLLMARVQTDGSFSRSNGARVAAIVSRPGLTESISRMLIIEASSSTEAEWASIAMGLKMALEANQETIGLENDCLDVVSALMLPGNPVKHEYARYYRNQIQRLANQTLWTGIRWIPRELNQADRLF